MIFQELILELISVWLLSLSFSLNIYLSIHPSIHPSNYLSIFLSIAQDRTGEPCIVFAEIPDPPCGNQQKTTACRTQMSSSTDCNSINTQQEKTLASLPLRVNRELFEQLPVKHISTHLYIYQLLYTIMKSKAQTRSGWTLLQAFFIASFHINT